MILDIGYYIAWYQKKIGTYDKQQWEKSVEQKILDGLNTVTLNKTAKLKTELIDVDLVRGSSFPKAKPKQNLFTVVRLAILRYIFLPAYAPWWVKQTSPNIFALLLFLYVTQMINWALYTCNSQTTEKISPNEFNKTVEIKYKMNNNSTENYNVSPTLSDLLIPMALSFLLSLIHSQIVATNIVSGAKVKRKRFSGPTSNTTQQREPKVRRRKKILKMRSQDTFEEKPMSHNHEDNVSGGMTTCSTNKATSTSIKGFKKSSNTYADKKRNVNWSYLHDDNTNVQSSCQDLTRTGDSPSCSKDLCKKNSVDNNLSSNQNISDDTCVREFVDDLIQLTVLNSSGNGNTFCSEINKFNTRRNLQSTTTVRGNFDDDGFESFNGKSSSGEDINPDRTCRKLFISDEISCSSHSNQKFQAKKKRTNKFESSSENSDEGDDERTSNTKRFNSNFNYNECTTSATEWLGITTNSEECSYSSDLDDTTDFKSHPVANEDCYDLDSIPTIILNAHGSTDRISCTIWVHDKNEFKKAQMSVLEISHMIIDRVDSMPETYDYIYIGMCFAVLLTLIPAFSRLCEAAIDLSNSNEINYLELPMILWQKSSFSLWTIFCCAFGNTQANRTVLIISLIQRFFLTTILFIIFAAAEKTFKQRFLFAKLFSHLTSLRRARKSSLPHFRLNKVRNIKTWLSVRSYLKKRGPQRSVDVIVSAAFLVTLFLLAFLSIEWLQDSAHMQSQLNLEALSWATTIGVFLLRYMTLGNKINQKYRCISILITEQINLYLQIEQKPNKKDELMVSNSVLKLAADLLKELESPFKISGLSANPYLFTTIKVVILSALSGVLSEMLGFKLKLHKIKIK